MGFIDLSKENETYEQSTNEQSPISSLQASGKLHEHFAVDPKLILQEVP